MENFHSILLSVRNRPKGNEVFSTLTCDGEFERILQISFQIDFYYVTFWERKL